MIRNTGFSDIIYILHGYHFFILSLL